MSDACAVVSRGKSKSIPRWCHHRPLRLTAALVATSTDPGSRSPIPIRKSMQTGQFQTPPAVRAWCAWTLALALAASAFGTPAQAQTSVALVSNQGQTNQAARNSPTLESDSAQLFTTGGETNGYMLTSVGIRISRGPSCPHTLRVHAATSNERPGVSLGALSPVTAGVGQFGAYEEYTASGDGIALDPGEKYLIVVDSTSDCFTSTVRTTESSAEDAGGAAGWSIENFGWERTWSSSTTAWTRLANTASVEITINGHVIVPNDAPTASAGEFTTTEDTDYTFTAGDFNFSDTDTDDVLSSVSIETLPIAGKGSLTLDGAAVSAGDDVTRAQIDDGDLKYTPPANSHGDDFATFTFKVSDGRAESAAAHTMTVNVTSVADPATGAPAIVGEGIAGVTLTLDLSGVADDDGLPATNTFEIKWYHTDDDATVQGSASTYTLGTSDVGKKLRVVVAFTDLEGNDEEVELATWPATGSIAPELTLSVDPLTLYEDGRVATVTIATAGGVNLDAAKTINLTIAGTATKGTDYRIASESLMIANGANSASTTITTITDSTADNDETVLVSAATAAGTAVGSQQTVTIKDPPALTLGVPATFTGSYVVEGDSVEVPVTLSGAPGREVTIEILTIKEQLASDSDFSTSSLSLTFGATETSKMVTFTVTDDSEVDPGELVVLEVRSSDLPAGISTSDSGGTLTRITLVDNDFQYEVTHADGTTLTVSEGAGTLTATVRVQTPGLITTDDLPALNEDVVLSVSTADGTAAAGDDYTAVSSQALSFSASDFSVISNCTGGTCARAEKTVSVPITDDSVYEGTTPETFTLTLSHANDQRVAYPPSSGEIATVSITDNDLPELTLSVSPATIQEDGGTATVTLATSDGANIAADTSITLTLAGSATKGTDYTISSESLTLAAGNSSVTATITATMDSTSDDNETVLISASSGGSAIGMQQTVTITESTAPTSSDRTVTMDEDTTYTFGASDFSFMDVDTGDALSSVKVETLPANGSLTLSGAAVSANATVTKAQLDNGDLKYTPAADGYGNNYASFMFKVNDGAVDSADAYTMTINVTNVNDAPTGAPAIVGEPKTGVTLSLDFSGLADADGLPDKFEINWFHTDNNNRSLGIGSTYELIQSDVGKNIKVRVEYEDLGGGKERLETASWPATGTIVDSNNEPTVANEIPDQEAVAGTSFSYQVPADTFNDADDDTLTYTANKADDASMLPTWLSFDAATRTFSGTPATTDLGTDSLQVTADDSNGGTNNDIFDITVVPALTVSFENVAYDVAEGNSVDVPLLLSGAPGREVTITLIAALRDGLSSSDYMVSSLSLTFGASETRKVATVTATDDSEVDPSEILILSLPTAADLPTGIGAGTVPHRRIHIADNDFQYQASHAGGTTLSVNEPAGTLTATVRVEAPNTLKSALDAINENVVLRVSTADGTATAGQDYTSLSQTLTFTPADFATQNSGCPQPTPSLCARADKTVTLAITDDTAYEGATAETFTLTLTHAADQRVTYPSPTGETATVSIADNEQPALTFTVSPTTILENAGTATVTLATAAGTGITADTAIALSLAGTATKGTDYTISSESLTLAAGQSSVTATITATMDTASDDNETVVVTASSGGTAIGTAQTVTITETLSPLSIAVSPASIAEAAGASTVTVSTGTAFATDQTIALTLGGTATVTTDYTLGSTSLTLTAGETSVTTTVTAVQDTIDEPNETVIVSASNGGTGIGSATVTITDDDDAPTLSLAVDPASIAEAAGTSTVTVSTGTTSFATDQTITLTLSGTATETTDYALGDSSLTLAAGETSVTTTVSAVQDTIDEPNETVIVYRRQRLHRNRLGDRHHHRRRRGAHALDRGRPGLHRRGGRRLDPDRQHRHLDLRHRPDHRPDPGRHGDRDHRLHHRRHLADAGRRSNLRDDHGDRGAGHRRRDGRDGHRECRQRLHRHRLGDRDHHRRRQRARTLDRGQPGLHRRGGRHLDGDRHRQRLHLHHQPDHHPDPVRHGDRDQRLHPRRLLADAGRRRDVRDDHGDRGAGHHRRAGRDGHRYRRQRLHRHRIGDRDHHRRRRRADI